MNSISLLIARFWLPGRRARSSDDIVALGLPFLGAVTTFKQHEASTQPSLGYESVWRSYQALTAKLADGQARVIAITSALPEEGKSVTAANLATALAREGHRVVLVDANFHWPALHSADAAAGLSSLLRNDSAEPASALVRTSERNLYLLPSGETLTSASNLLRGPRMREILGALRSLADFVIVDTPPVLEGRDAEYIAASSDATVMVVDASSTRTRTLRGTLAKLARAGVIPAGAILNRASETALSLPAAPEGSAEQGQAVVQPMNAAPLRGMDVHEPSADGNAIAAALESAFQETSRPRLRLVQPYERPLLPFGDTNPGTTSADVDIPAEEPLEITVDELLVDLEETLSLIRHLKERHRTSLDA